MIINNISTILVGNMNLKIAIPEIFLVFSLLCLLLIEAFIKNKFIKEYLVYSMTIFVLYFMFIINLYLNTNYHLQNNSLLAFNSMFILDYIAFLTKAIVYLVAIFIAVYIRPYLQTHKLLFAEFYIIFLFAILGMLVMISANNLLILYVGLELLSLSLYGLIAMNNKNLASIEAAIKYFVLGSLASGLLLYGISFVYGATHGALQLNQIFQVLYHDSNINHNILLFALVFIIAGLLFKLGLVPFHMWVPDVYEGATYPVVLIITSLSKIATVVFIFRFLINGLLVLGHSWAPMIQALAIASLLLGNIVAISQTNLKRMLAYSTIAHMSFIAFGFITFSAIGLSASFFYLTTYVITALLGFGVLITLSNAAQEISSLEDLKGLSISHPVYAAILSLVMLSLAGIPPFIGFYAKFDILSSMINTGYINTAVFAVIMSLIGAFYYLRVIKLMYFDNITTQIVISDKYNYDVKIFLALNTCFFVAFSIMPNRLLHLFY